MPSRLRHNISFEEQEAVTAIRSSASPPPSKKQKMSLSQTYYVASAARSKLGKEAVKPDHNLRLLVGHANLLDALMLELRDAEREQEAWFNASVRGAQEDESKHIRWADTIVEEDDYSDSDSDSDSEFDEDDFEIAIPRRLISAPVTITSQEMEVDEEEMGYEDFEYSSDLALTRTSSHPPELIDDSESDDDMSPPTTPPQAILEFSEKGILDMSLPAKHSISYQHLIPQSAAPLIQSY